MGDSWNLKAKSGSIAAILVALAVSGSAMAQAIFVTPAAFQAHCSARFAFEASRAKQESEAAHFRSLSLRAMELARARKFGSEETDDKLQRYAENFGIFLREKSASNPELETVFARAVEQCRKSLDGEAG